MRFSFFSKAALDTLQSLFWIPDIIICNDWQTSFVPTLLKEKYINEEFYSQIKTVYMIHSINNYRNFSKSTYDMLDLKPSQSHKQIDNHIQAMEHADLTILLNYESEKLIDKLKKQKNLFDKFVPKYNLRIITYQILFGRIFYSNIWILFLIPMLFGSNFCSKVLILSLSFEKKFNK